MEKARQYPALTLAALLLPCAAVAQDVTLPSGLVAAFLDQGVEEGGTLLRLRFVAPDLAPGGDHTDDMQALCEGPGLTLAAALAPAPLQVVITLSDRALPLGEAAPDATQHFEAFVIADGTCRWELF